MDPATQTILSIGVPTVAVLIGILVNNSRQTDTNARISELRSQLDVRFDMMHKYIDARFNEAGAELRRVEEVLDARLKHLEERVR